MTWPAGIEIVDARIAAGEPVTEDLMHDLRDRDDWLHDRVEVMGRLILTGLGTLLTAQSLTLDDSLDWRDRFIKVSGIVYLRDTAINAAALLPGGAEDDRIGQDNVNGAYFNSQFNSEWMYSSDGSIDRNTNPLMLDQYVAGQEGRIWVNSANGHLMFGVDVIDAVKDNQAYCFMIWYSEDQGEY